MPGGAAAWDDVLDLAWDQEAAPDGRSPLENLGVFCTRLRRRIKKKWQNVIVVDGPTGTGKSSLGIQLAQGVDPRWEPSHTAYSAEDAMSQWRLLEKGQVLLYDEAVLGLLSQGGGRRNDELVQLVQALSIIRAKGITTVVCLPSIWMLDSFAREGLADYWLSVYARGRARPHRAWDHARYKRPTRLPYDRIDELQPIGFRNLDRTKVWSVYYVRKIAAIEAFLANRAADPSGKMARCPACGLTGSRWNVKIHRCPGPPASGGAPSAQHRTGAP